MVKQIKSKEQWIFRVEGELVGFASNPAIFCIADICNIYDFETGSYTNYFSIFMSLFIVSSCKYILWLVQMQSTFY